MPDYKVSSTDVSSIADAIRTKGGTSGSMIFPDGFLSAIGNIPTSEPSTIISGTFTGTTNGEAKTITIPYTGSGYPVAGIVFPTGGIYKSGSTFASTIQKKAVAMYCFVKNDSSTTPDYTNDTAINQATVCVLYKSNDQDADSISQNMTTNARLFVSGAAVGNSSIYRVVKINGATSFSVYIPSTDQYGFMKDAEYTYLLMYSS